MQLFFTTVLVHPLFSICLKNRLKKFINRHLPKVPSEAQVQAEGIDLAEMNAILLRQIEELTLRVISLQEQVEQMTKTTTNENTD